MLHQGPGSSEWCHHTITARWPLASSAAAQPLPCTACGRSPPCSSPCHLCAPHLLAPCTRRASSCRAEAARQRTLGDLKQSSLALGSTRLEPSNAPAASPNKPPPSTKPWPAGGMCPSAVPTGQMPRCAHLSFLHSPRAAGLTAILGNVEAEVWDWLHEDRVSMFRGDCGGVLHSECDNEPVGRGAKEPGLCNPHLCSPVAQTKRETQPRYVAPRCGHTIWPRVQALGSAWPFYLAPRHQAEAGLNQPARTG